MAYKIVDPAMMMAGPGPHPAASPYDKRVSEVFEMSAFEVYKVDLPTEAESVRMGAMRSILIGRINHRVKTPNNWGFGRTVPDGEAKSALMPSHQLMPSISALRTQCSRTRSGSSACEFVRPRARGER